MTSTTEISANAATSLRRTASRTVSMAIVHTAFTFLCLPLASAPTRSPARSLLLQQLEEPLFEALLLRYDRLDLPAERDDRADQFGDPPGRHVLDQQPVPLPRPAAEPGQRLPPAVGQAVDPQPDAGPGALQLTER